jgi:hypothetical protein
MRKTLLAAGAALALGIALAVTECGGGDGSFTAHGTDTVMVNPLNGQNVQEAYPDMTAGAQVTVTDSSGKVIGTGTLASDPGATLRSARMLAAGIPGTSAGTYLGWVAVYSFTVTVPGGQPRYGIEIGHNRGTVWFTPAQMQKGPGLSLGSMSG